MLDLVDANRVIASFPITPGSKSLPAPIGTWKVVKVTTMPEILERNSKYAETYNKCH